MSDLCTGIGWVPSIPAVVLKSWPFGRGFCVFCIYLILTNLGISIILILLVTYDCFIAVVYPYKYASMITKSRAIAVSLFVTFSYYAVMAVFIGVGSKGPFTDVKFYPMVGFCYVNFVARGPFTYSMYGVSYILLLFAIMMTIMQGMVANVSRKQARRIAESEGRFRHSALTEDFKTDAMSSDKTQKRKGPKGDPRMPGRRQPSELKGVLVCIAVSVAFFVAWLPTAVWQIYTVHFGECVSSVAFRIVVILSTPQCWINPFIYMVMKRNYRQRLYKILDPIFKRCRIQVMTDP
ncbi:beta-1 adrenergic receptor-like [Strongylocentrotus purpuratus]|uniref:G-protein coupled receptors family 1 profile domain-containing protein n=1 Tax=Strongylocentrotus purpuratus TaxID=7668 RepID=A0A7M7RDL7_STRPU|nr:beta-1 adrenergic receptor-like [Strongylocentrotus purpuratus]|eukprot:XP_001194869.1 PREDICTED: beta-1 adrenergic receptor-like [Strongylocentrotus purpuratus]